MSQTPIHEPDAPRRRRLSPGLLLIGAAALVLIVYLASARQSGSPGTVTTPVPKAAGTRVSPTGTPAGTLDTVEGWADRGAINLLQDDYAAAIAAYSRAIELDPTLATSYQMRGYAYRRQGDYPAAIEDYTRAVELDPRLPDPHRGMGIIYELRGDPALALEEYCQYVALGGNSASTSARIEELGGCPEE